MTRRRGQETLGDPGHDLGRFGKEVLLSASFVYQTSYCPHRPKRGFHGISGCRAGPVTELLLPSCVLELIEKKGVPADTLDRFNHVIHEHKAWSSSPGVSVGVAALGCAEGGHFWVVSGECL